MILDPLIFDQRHLLEVTICAILEFIMILVKSRVFFMPLLVESGVYEVPRRNGS